MAFHDLYHTLFDFLCSRYGFQLQEKPSYPFEVEFRKEPLSITFISGKGVIDIDFWISLEFTDNHAIFRPYISRQFSLGELAQWHDPRAFDHWEPFPFIVNASQAEQFLKQSAELMLNYCEPLLRGDLSSLEEITKQRRLKSK
jgi:hypothetical protein